ncbi:MAG TPA: ATP-binding protein [Rhizorhapis sp.]|nr:ATP-binding protein [Rhizorhapis sp.]
MTDKLLSRIAEALDRLAPPLPAPADLSAFPAYLWDGSLIQPVPAFAPIAYDLLTGIDAQKAQLLENSRRLALGHAAHDVLLWGARGTGKSASVSSVVGKLQAEGQDIALVQFATDRLKSLPDLFSILRGTSRPFILFIDDLGFDDVGGDARAFRSLLQGSATARLDNVRLYVTSNRRHIVPRNMGEQDDPINKRDVVDDKMALSDRFGLSLGFHNIDQDAYLAIVSGYAAYYGLPFDAQEAVQWATVRGSRSGRVAWQYVVELAGRAGLRI